MASIKNIAGNQYGLLTVVSIAGLRRNKYQWKCKCACGGTRISTACALKSGRTRSCGCIRARKFESELLGKVFERLTVVEFTGFSERRGGHQRRVGLWKCRCVCGNEVIHRTTELIRETVKSCGCLPSDLARQLGKRAADWTKTHGMTGTSTYITWRATINRCYYVKHKSYDAYGGRGITVCDRWHTFENFMADMGERPPGTSINRIDNDGNYEPGNCEWATPKTQAQNRRKQKNHRGLNEHK